MQNEFCAIYCISFISVFFCILYKRFQNFEYFYNCNKIVFKRESNIYNKENLMVHITAIANLNLQRPQKICC